MYQTLDSTPKKDGFRMPGEFEPHAKTWMLWPERPDNWRLGAKPAQKAFVNVAAAIAQFEPVTMGVSRAQFVNARGMLPPQVRVVEISNDDSWIRDCGPTFVVNDQGETRGIDWDFNAWGGLVNGLYFPWDQDDLVPQKVLNIEEKARYNAPIVLEGGSIHVDGEGTLYTTSECLLDEGRNPDLSKEEIEAALSEYLNIEKVIWIPRGVYNDETNGHVDNIITVARPGEVILTWTDDPDDPQYEISREAYEVLTRETDARGRRVRVHKLHQPNPILITREESEGVDAVDGTLPRLEGDRLAASYVNFLIVNGGVIAPVFNDEHDEAALRLLGEIFPDRKVVGVYAREILLGGGNIHCITQQQPKG
ncbi:MAG: agmatine deiminase [Anaerolineaceae bacterium]|nr:agmatine deiminase [Anaerolineaceae bacterium]